MMYRIMKINKHSREWIHSSIGADKTIWDTSSLSKNMLPPLHHVKDHILSQIKSIQIFIYKFLINSFEISLHLFSHP